MVSDGIKVSGSSVGIIVVGSGKVSDKLSWVGSGAGVSKVVGVSFGNVSGAVVGSSSMVVVTVIGDAIELSAVVVSSSVAEVKLFSSAAEVVISAEVDISSSGSEVVLESVNVEEDVVGFTAFDGL